MSTCSAQLIVHESMCFRFFFNELSFNRILSIIESEEEKKSYAEQNTPHFAVRLKDTEVMENTFLRFMVKVVGEPRPKIEL